MSICLLENGTLLTGGLDGKLSTWDANKYFNTPLQEVQVNKCQMWYCDWIYTRGAALWNLMAKLIIVSAD